MGSDPGRVALLWHLHQPDVRDPVTGAPRLPWVRHHALRGYFDLVSESLEHGDAVTLNFSGVLLDQLRDVCVAGTADPLRRALARDPGDIGPDERRALIRLATAGHPVLRRPWHGSVGDALVDDASMRDLVVWSALQWFGAVASAEEPAVEALRQKGRGFHRADQEALVAAHDAVLARLWQRVGQLGASPVGLSASPFHHPILPLLVDTAHARRSLPGVEDVGFRHPDDARIELRDGRAAVAEATGRDVVGLWPSEGAVSPESMALAKEVGFRWFASDDGVLARSDRDGAGGGPWSVDGGPLGFFRDHGWSDRLSFDAVRQNPDAVARAMADAARSASLLVALDGENPWEASPDAGAALRAALRRHLGNRRLTLDAWADEPPVGRIRRLHTGSWVDATLGIWYGDAEDRRLWRALRRVRDALAVAGPHLRVAEGSDWTWWTGAEFDTPFRADYEDLFRSRLEAASQALRSDPPESWRALSVPGGSMAASGGAFRWGRDALGRLWVDGTGWLREGASVRPLSGARPLTEVTPCEVATDPDGPWARVPADQGAVVHRHVVRLREVDAAGIAFFGRIFEIAHDAWEAVVREAGHPMATITSSAPWRLPLVHASADFASPLRLGDEIDVTVRLTTVGVSSVALHFELHRGAVLLATVHTVHVCVDAQSFASRPLDGEFLAGLRRVLP